MIQFRLSDYFKYTSFQIIKNSCIICRWRLIVSNNHASFDNVVVNFSNYFKSTSIQTIKHSCIIEFDLKNFLININSHPIEEFIRDK